MLSAFFKIKKCTIEIKGILSQRRTLITTVLWSGHRRALVSPGASTLTNQAERLMGRNRERQRQTKREGERNTRKYMKGKKTGLLNLQLICQSNPPPLSNMSMNISFIITIDPCAIKNSRGSALLKPQIYAATEGQQAHGHTDKPSEKPTLPRAQYSFYILCTCTWTDRISDSLHRFFSPFDLLFA